MEIKIHAALPVTCAVFSHAQHKRDSAFLQINSFTKYSTFIFPQKSKKQLKKQWYSDRVVRKISSLYFLFIYLFDCLSHQVVLTLLEPKLANKYNEMLKRTIEFQIQYSSQNVSDQETYVLLLQVTTDKSMRLPL